MFGGASVLTASVLVLGLGAGLVTQVFAGRQAPEGDCPTRVVATNELVKRTVLATLPAGTVREVHVLEPAEIDIADCAWDDTPGGLEALWNGATGAATVRLLQKEGWQRTFPAGGPPGWYVRDEPAGADLKVTMSDPEAILLTKEQGKKRFGISIDKVGMSAWID
jgi:hypothetical protein